MLADFNKSFVERTIDVTHKNLFPFEWQFSSPKPPVWDYDKHFGYSKDEMSKVWASIKRDHHFWEDLEPLRGMDEFNLMRIGVQDSIYFITTRVGLTAHWQSKNWLAQHGFENADVMIAYEKGPVLKALKIDVFIDDKTENIQEAVLCSPDTRSYLLDAPYNAQCEKGFRVFSVQEMLQNERLI